MNSLVQEINLDRGNNRVWVQYYEQANFIFAMRETTTMQIADQFLDRLEFVAKYFDISMDTDKAYVVEKNLILLINIEAKLKIEIFYRKWILYIGYALMYMLRKIFFQCLIMTLKGLFFV